MFTLAYVTVFCLLDLKVQFSRSPCSLIGSFVPFGGFFSTPSDFRNPASCTNTSSALCDTCNEKYEQEVADIVKVGPATSASGGCSTSLPWLQKVNVDSDRGLDLAKVCCECDHLILYSLVQCMQRYSHAHTHKCNNVGAIAVLTH